MRNLEPYTSVDVRFQGRNTGKGYSGVIIKTHTDGTYDIERISAPYGIQFSVPQAIVFPSEKPYICLECGKRLPFSEAFFYSDLVYCAAHLPLYDKHQQF